MYDREQQRQAFVQAILEQPHNDDLRLIYADWLEEQNEAQRAEIIRVQIELAKLPPLRTADIEERQRKLRFRQEQLLDMPSYTAWCWESWAVFAVGGRHRMPNPGSCQWFWGRGFPEALDMPTLMFLILAKRMFSTVPILQVRLPDLRKWMRKGRAKWAEYRELHDLLSYALQPHVPDQHGFLLHDETLEREANPVLVNWGRRQAGLPPLP